MADLRCQPKWPFKIQVHDGLKQALSHLMAGASGGHSRIVNQQINAAKGVVSCVDKGITFRPAANMGGIGQGLATHGPDFRRDGFARLNLAAGDDDIRPTRGQGLGHVIAKAAASARDKGNLARKIKQRVDCHSFALSCWLPF